MAASLSNPLVGLTGLAVALAACAANAQLLEAVVALDPSDLSINRLSILSDPDASTAALAFESTGAVLSDRVEIRFNAQLDFSPLEGPPGWQSQSALVNESGIPVTVVTYFFAGLDPGNSAEFVSFEEPWQVAFRLHDPAPEDDSGAAPLTISMAVAVHATSIVPGFGIVPATGSFALAATLDSPRTRLPFSFLLEDGDPTGPTMRLSPVLPGISYCIESSSDLAIWSKRVDFVSPVELTGHPLPLGGGWHLREFFRLLILPVRP